MFQINSLKSIDRFYQAQYTMKASDIKYSPTSLYLEILYYTKLRGVRYSIQIKYKGFYRFLCPRSYLLKIRQYKFWAYCLQFIHRFFFQIVLCKNYTGCSNIIYYRVLEFWISKTGFKCFTYVKCAWIFLSYIYIKLMSKKLKN